MHSFLKNNDDTYVVGIWLVAAGGDRGCTFTKMFDVADLLQAIAAVSRLNGGDGTFQITKEHL